MDTAVFRHQTAMINGVRLHYVTAGKASALVLIHGLPTSWYEWRGILPMIAERFTVIAPDLRGLGNSSKPPGGYNTHTAAEDIHQLVRSMGIDRVFVAGHDWGASVGFAYAVHYPQEVRRLAILDMAVPGFGEDDGFRVTRQAGRIGAARGPWHAIFNMVPDVPEAFMNGLFVQ
jgi:pimeloyl-ACP methyl ester carboxylesterase